MASGIYLSVSVRSPPLVGYNKPKQMGRGSTLEETQPDYAIRSSVAITKLPLGRAILKEEEQEEQQKKEKCDFIENILSPDFLTFRLSYSTYSLITGSGTQQVNCMEKFSVKSGISCRFILY